MRAKLAAELMIRHAQQLCNHRRGRHRAAEVHLDLVAHDGRKILGRVQLLAALFEEGADHREEKRVRVGHARIQVAAAEGEGIGAPAELHRGAEAALMLAMPGGAVMLEPHLERHPVRAQSGPEDVAEHAERQFRILLAVGDPRIEDVIAQPEDAAVLDQREAGLVLMRGEIDLHVAQRRRQRRRADRRVSDRAQVPRLEMAAELEPDMIVVHILGGAFEERAVLAQIELLHRVGDVIYGDTGAPEDRVHVAAVALKQVGRTGRRRGQNLRRRRDGGCSGLIQDPLPFAARRGLTHVYQ